MDKNDPRTATNRQAAFILKGRQTAAEKKERVNTELAEAVARVEERWANESSRGIEASDATLLQAAQLRGGVYDHDKVLAAKLAGTATERQARQLRGDDDDA